MTRNHLSFSTVSAETCFVFYSRLFEYSQNTAEIEHKDRRGQEIRNGAVSRVHVGTQAEKRGREGGKTMKEQQTGARQVSCHFTSSQVLYERGHHRCVCVGGGVRR